MVVKYALSELSKGAELYKLFKAIKELLPNFKTHLEQQGSSNYKIIVKCENELLLWARRNPFSVYVHSAASSGLSLSSYRTEKNMIVTHCMGLDPPPPPIVFITIVSKSHFIMYWHNQFAVKNCIICIYNCSDL